MALEVGALFVRLELDTSTFSKQFEKVENSIKQLAKSGNLNFTANIQPNVNQAPIQEATNNVKTMSRAVQDAGMHFYSLGNAIKMALTFNLANMVTAPIMNLGDALKGTGQIAVDFEKQMSAVKAVLDPTAQEFEALRQKGIELGKQTAFTSTEAAQAMEELAKQGVSITDILGGAAQATVDLASATGSDLVSSATVATDVMNAFGLKGTELERAIDGVTGTVNASKFDLRDYQLALAQGGAASHSYGLELEDFNAIIAATSYMFYSGREAGTALKTVIQRLTPNTDTAAEAMRELGLITAEGANVFYNANGTLKSGAEIAGIISTAFKGLSEEQRAAYTEAIFGNEALGAVIGMMEQGEAGVRKFAEAIGETSAAEEAATRLDNFAGVIEQIKGSWEAFSITVMDKVLPSMTEVAKGFLEVVNTATTVAEAIFGSQDAFNQLSPTLQTVIVIIQELSAYFGSLAAEAWAWGSNIASQFGSGLLSAASEITSALMEMGSWISYWLAPGSPPRIVPDLDQYGKEAATVYWESWNEGDFSALKNMGNTVRGVLEGLVDSGSLSQTNVIPTLIGTREAFQTAIDNVHRIGSVSEESLQAIFNSAGTAGSAIEGLVRSYFDYRSEINQTAAAQRALEEAQRKLNDVMSEYNVAIDPLEAELDKILAAQDALDLEKQIKKYTELANAIGGDGTKQKEAQLKLQELQLRKEIAAKKEEYQGIINNAQAEVDANKQALEDQKAKEDAAKAQFEIEQQKLALVKENNALVKEQVDLLKKLAEEAKKASESKKETAKKPKKSDAEKEAEAAKKAQDEYNLSIADTDGKLAILRQRLGEVKVGSANYYEILGQIHRLEEQKAKEVQKAADQEAKEREKALQAEEDYKMSIMSTSEKIEYLKGKLGTLQQGSAEYYKTLGEISKLEKQAAKDAEAAAKKKAGGSGGGGGISGVPKPGTVKPIDASPIQDVSTTFQDAKTKIEEAKVSLERFREGMSQARENAMNFLSPLKGVIDFIQANFIPILAGLATPIVIGLAGAIGGALVGALGALLSPMFLVSAGVALLALAWQNNWGGIQEHTARVIEFIKTIISQFLIIVKSWWDEHGTEVTATVNVMWERIKNIISTILDIIGKITEKVFSFIAEFIADHHEEIKNVISAAWNFISGFVQGILSVIQKILEFWLALVQGKWSAAWEAIKALLVAAWNFIWTTIVNFLNLVASFWGTSLTNILNLWSSNWDKIKAYGAMILATILAYVIEKVNIIIEKWNGFVETVKRVWSETWDTVKQKLTETLSAMVQYIKDKVEEFKTAIKLIVAGILLGWELISGTGEGSLYQKTVDGLSSIKEKLYDMIEGFVTAAEDIGKGIVDGMMRGLGDASKIQELIDKAKKLAQRAIDAVRNTLDMNSPSRVFQDIGLGVTEGMVLGVNDGIPDIAAAVNKMTASNIITPSLNAMNGKGGANISNTFYIDARGSSMSEDQFRKVVVEVTDEQARRAVNRR